MHTEQWPAISTIGVLWLHLHCCVHLSKEGEKAAAWESLQEFVRVAFDQVTTAFLFSSTTSLAQLEGAWPVAAGDMALAVDGPLIEVSQLSKHGRVWAELEAAQGLPVTERVPTHGAAASSSQGVGPPGQWVPLADLLLLLHCSCVSMCQRLAQQLLRFMACVVEQAPWVTEATTNPFQASFPRGSKRRRVVGQSIKDAMAQTAAQGKVGKTVQQVARAMVHFQPGKQFEPPAHGQPLHKARMSRYHGLSREVFSFDRMGPFVSVAEDGARIASFDMIYSALYSPLLDVACWMPPKPPP